MMSVAPFSSTLKLSIMLRSIELKSICSRLICGSLALSITLEKSPLSSPETIELISSLGISRPK